MAYKAIGEQLTFTNAEGATMTGKVVGRDWCFERLAYYTVRVAGKCYNVNADTMQSGHSF